MEDNFFDEDYSEPKNETIQQGEQQHIEEPHQEFGEYEEHGGQQQDQYQQFGEPSQGQGHGEVEQVQEPQRDLYFETMIEMRRRDQEIQHNLQKKGNEERGLKQQRKQKGKRELEQFKANREKEIERNRARNGETASKAEKAKEYRNQWEKVTDNIALKAGEYPGKKDVTRMRDAIVKKSKD